MHPVLIDIETRSACDLRDEGGHNYAAHPSTRLLTAAWTDDGGATIHVWVPGHESVPQPDADAIWHYGPECPLAHLTDRTWVAHNAWGFDRLVWAALRLPAPRKWYDTAVLALAAGLPGKLDQIGQRLWGEGKQKAGASALHKHMRAKDAEDADPRNVPAGITRLIASYNIQDVRLLANLWDELSASLTLTPTERAVQEVHDRINERGVRLDVDLVRALRDLSNQAVAEAVTEIARITDGALPDVATLQSRNRVIDWLERYGLRITVRDSVTRKVKVTLRREIVEQWLAEFGDVAEDATEPLDLPESGATIDPQSLRLCARVLTLRNAVLRITGKKLTKALASVNADGVVRGMFAYSGAHTGRWAGRRIQVQNLTKPHIGVKPWRLTRAFEAMGRLDAETVHAMGCDYSADGTQIASGTPYTLDDAAGSMLRAMFVPHEGHECLLAGDYSSIEARVLAWLAGDKLLLGAFQRMECPYSLMASKLYGRPVRDKKDPIRHVGKTLVLGAGYGLGAVKFALYGAAAGIDFDAMNVTPEQCIDTFRDTFPHIAGHVVGDFDGRPVRRGGLWRDLDSAAVSAVSGGGEVRCGRLTFRFARGHLYVALPSGRELCYRQARVVSKTAWWGKEIDQVQYQSPRFRAVEQYGGKWAENVVQAVSRDILAEALVRLEAAGLPVVLHVHDEAVVSGHLRQFKQFMALLTTPPKWADGLPLDAEGGALPRYAKAPPPDWPKEVTYRNGGIV